MKTMLMRSGLAVVAALTLGLAGCGGGGSSTTPEPTPEPEFVMPAPTGTSPITLTANTPATTFAALQPKVTVGKVTIASPPVVHFSMTDQDGNAIIGFGSTTQSATATVPSYTNLAFALAKLVPGANGSPSKWVSYIVTTVPTKNATTGAVTAAAPTRPSTDNTGTLVDHGNGTYTYTFYRDITTVKDQVAAMEVKAPNDKADLGDLTYEPSLVHRLTIQVSGNAPGTGTNTATGVQVTAGVPMKNAVDVIYDFVPATGEPVPAGESGREITATAKCNECHRVLGGVPGGNPESNGAGFHGGSRNEVRYCVVCHTEQRKYGQTEAAYDPSTMSFLATGNPPTISTRVVNGRAVGNLPNYIHKTHMGELLAKKNYDYAGVKFNNVLFPQDIRNCTKCHDGGDTSTAKTAQGNNWMEKPSRLACGSCHDGINFETGKGVTLADAAQGLTTSTHGHVGGAQADDSLCALCHKPTTIDVAHLPVTPPNPGSFHHIADGSGNANTNSAWIASNTSRLPAGAIKVSYDIKSVSTVVIGGIKRPQMVFRLLQNGARADLQNADTAPVNPATGKQEIWANFMGAPSVYFVFAVPQDGIPAPADFNASVSAYLRCLWNGTDPTPEAGECTSGGTLTGPDADGYYTATLTAGVIPDSAVMLTGGLGYSYNARSTMPLTQTNLPDYPTSPSLVASVGATDQSATPTQLMPNMPNRIGGLIVIAPNAQKVADGYTGRRAIVEDTRCNACHQELGTFTEDAFHAGQRNDGTTCSWCHTPNRTSSGWSADSEHFVHAIHAGKKRSVPFTWHAPAVGVSFEEVEYPGILAQCETCHLPNTYNFGTSAAQSALPSRLYRSVATGTFSSSATALAQYSMSPWITKDFNYGSGFSFNANSGATTAAAASTLVISPIAGACTACHVSDLALQHIQTNGGSFYEPRSTALAKSEQCTLCHGPGKVADIKVMHAK